MLDLKPKPALNAARKKLVAMCGLGVLLLALAPAIPGLLARWHFGTSGLGTRIEWRVIVIGLILVVAPVYVLIKFRKEEG